MNKIIPLAFVLSITLGILFQNKQTYHTDTIYAQYKQEVKEYQAKVREQKYQEYLASLSGWQRFKDEVVRLAKKHNFTPNVPIAQCALESARGTSYFAVNRNNFCGIGAYDHDPNKAFTFKSPEEHAQYWVKLISNRYTLAWANRQDPVKMVYYIKEGGYASSPNYVNKVTSMPEFKSF